MEGRSNPSDWGASSTTLSLLNLLSSLVPGPMSPSDTTAEPVRPPAMLTRSNDSPSFFVASSVLNGETAVASRRNRFRICGAESVLSVGSPWQKNIPRRLFLAPVASTYGRVRPQPQLNPLHDRESEH
jgi:hypothetical protein